MLSIITCLNFGCKLFISYDMRLVVCSRPGQSKSLGLWCFWCAHVFGIYGGFWKLSSNGFTKSNEGITKKMYLHKQIVKTCDLQYSLQSHCFYTFPYTIEYMNFVKRNMAPYCSENHLRVRSSARDAWKKETANVLPWLPIFRYENLRDKNCFWLSIYE